MKHSERAAVIANHYGSLKRQGYRSDLIEEIEAMTYSPLANKSSMWKLGEQYVLSNDTIHRYLRVKRRENCTLRSGHDFLIKKQDLDAVEEQLNQGKKLTIKIANLRIKIKPVKFSGQFLSEFFDESKSAEEIEATVAEALRAYFGKQNDNASG